MNTGDIDGIPSPELPASEPQPSESVPMPIALPGDAEKHTRLLQRGENMDLFHNVFRNHEAITERFPKVARAPGEQKPDEPDNIAGNNDGIAGRPRSVNAQAEHDSAVTSEVLPTTSKAEVDLEAQMARAQLQELGWRDRDDINHVMKGLEKLARSDWQSAAALWQKFRPDDPDKPDFIDGDDKDVVGDSAKRHERSNRQGPDDEQPTETEQPSPPRGLQKTDASTVPVALTKRYLVAGQRFYFRDDPNLLAFEDKGERLSTEHTDPMVVHSMVRLAEAKHWTTIKVKGHSAFRREAWIAASLVQITVKGYEPNDVDKAKLDDLLKEADRNRNPGRAGAVGTTKSRRELEPTETTRSRYEAPTHADKKGSRRSQEDERRQAIATMKAILAARGDSANAIDIAAKDATERFLLNRGYSGRLVEHGPAPYQNKAGNAQNYFASLETESGIQTVWGNDLPRALSVANAQIGDFVTLVTRSQKALADSGPQPSTNDSLNPVGKGTSMIPNTWEVASAGHKPSGHLDRLRTAEAIAKQIVAAHSVPGRRSETRFNENDKHRDLDI